MELTTEAINTLSIPEIMIITSYNILTLSKHNQSYINELKMLIPTYPIRNIIKDYLYKLVDDLELKD